MRIGKHVKVTGMDESEIGFEIFENSGTHDCRRLKK
jgi:hypothetical protein